MNHNSFNPLLIPPSASEKIAEIVLGLLPRVDTDGVELRVGRKFKMLHVIEHGRGPGCSPNLRRKTSVYEQHDKTRI